MNTAAIKSFKALRTAYGELGTFRSGDSKLKPDDFKPIAEKLASAAKPVVEEMKGKTSPVQKKLLSLAKKLQSLAKEESLVQPVELEKTIDKTIDDLAKLLGT